MGTCVEVGGQVCGLIDVGLWDYELYPWPETGKVGCGGVYLLVPVFDRQRHVNL